jgi:hypothetical protein
MKKSERDIFERTIGSKKFGYFWMFLGIWIVLDSIRESRSEVWTDPWFWIGLLIILVWGRILVVYGK